MIDSKNFFDQPINSNIKTQKNIRKIATGQGDDYMTDCQIILTLRTITKLLKQI